MDMVVRSISNLLGFVINSCWILPAQGLDQVLKISSLVLFGAPRPVIKTCNRLSFLMSCCELLPLRYDPHHLSFT
jgi:hypothetical protein